jgi:hypothetical protein
MHLRQRCVPMSNSAAMIATGEARFDIDENGPHREHQTDSKALGRCWKVRGKSSLRDVRAAGSAAPNAM